MGELISQSVLLSKRTRWVILPRVGLGHYPLVGCGYPVSLDGLKTGLVFVSRLHQFPPSGGKQLSSNTTLTKPNTNMPKYTRRLYLSLSLSLSLSNSCETEQCFDRLLRPQHQGDARGQRRADNIGVIGKALTQGLMTVTNFSSFNFSTRLQTNVRSNQLPCLVSKCDCLNELQERQKQRSQ